MTKRVAVYGASGHTGRFVVAELERRGLTPVACGRGSELPAALRGVHAVINCAGPFAHTAAPVIRAAIRAGVPYLDVTAEIEVVAETFAAYRDAPIPIVPAAAFYGGVADLLATANRLPGQELIRIGYALSGWRPTPGTRATGQVSARRRDGHRLVFRNGALHRSTGPAPRTTWTFPAPIGARPVTGEFATADSVTIPAHLEVAEIDTFITTNAVADLRADDPSGPVAVDAQGRSAQTFLVEVVTRAGADERRAAVRGRDIYATTAPLVVTAAERILAGDGAFPGVGSLGARFDPADFLAAAGLP